MIANPTRSSATADRAIQVLTRIIGNHADDHVCLVEAGALRIALREMEDHAHCEEEIDDVRGEESKRYDEEFAEFGAAARDLIAAVDAVLRTDAHIPDGVSDNLTDALSTLKGLV